MEYLIPPLVQYSRFSSTGAGGYWSAGAFVGIYGDYRDQCQKLGVIRVSSNIPKRDVLGLLSVVEPRTKTLPYEVKPTELGVLAVPLLVIVGINLLSAIPAVIRGIKIDPVEMLCT
jgi:hypothetical protein